MYIDGNLNEAQLCSLSGNEETQIFHWQKENYLIEKNQQVSYTYWLFFLFRQVIFYTLLQSLSLLFDSLEINNNNV